MKYDMIIFRETNIFANTGTNTKYAIFVEKCTMSELTEEPLIDQNNKCRTKVLT